LEPEWSKWKPYGKSIFNEIRKAEVFVGNKKYVYDRKPGTAFILNRQEFISQLCKWSEELGTIINTNDKINSFQKLNGDYIIDASGCPSVIKRKFGFKKGIKGFSYQQTLENANCFISDKIKMYYAAYGGYYWIFPRDPNKREINVGVGLDCNTGYNLKKLLESFKKKHKIEGNINYILGGLIPEGFQNPLKFRNILFVGDAGIGAHVLSGQGIYRALISGDVAGRCIAYKYPERYPKIMRKFFLKEDWKMIKLMRMNNILRKINPDLVLSSINRFAGLEKIH
jgi:flavin-dependent dehydrogenase